MTFPFVYENALGLSSDSPRASLFIRNVSYRLSAIDAITRRQFTLMAVAIMGEVKC